MFNWLLYCGRNILFCQVKRDEESVTSQYKESMTQWKYKSTREQNLLHLSLNWMVYSCNLLCKGNFLVLYFDTFFPILYFDLFILVHSSRYCYLILWRNLRYRFDMLQPLKEESEEGLPSTLLDITFGDGRSFFIQRE